MSNVFFTSDLHLGHAKVAELRGFDSPAEHDEALADHWRSTVRREDEVWVLGDVTANGSNKVLGPALDLLFSLPGTKHLILGNHDGAHPMFRDAHKKQALYLSAFASVASAARRRIEGQEVLLSHFPYERDRGETRYRQWRLHDEGLPLLHGHTHGTERLTVDADEHRAWGGQLVKRTVRRVEIHVGLDAWNNQLVPLETVAALLKEAHE